MALSLKTPEEVALEIASRLRTRRLAQNLTQAGLASRAGMSTPSLKRFEKTGEISFVSLLKIALVLGCLDKCEELFAASTAPASLFTPEPRVRKRGSIR